MESTTQKIPATMPAREKSLSVADLIEKEQLENLTPEIDVANRPIAVPGVTRPALPLAGFFEYFNDKRVLVMGAVEDAYLKRLPQDEARERFEKVIERHSPCVIYARGLSPDMGMIAACHRHEVPLLQSDRETLDLVAELTRWLGVQLAPSELVHGVLIDVYGEGVLITGESGIGKSEVALELIRRGHRLVADDAVELKKVSAVTLVGSAPPLTKHLLELRGIGVMNILEMFGVGSVIDTQRLSLAIRLESWDGTEEYDRLGMAALTATYLGNAVPLYRIPIRPGRNVAMLVESCAIRQRAKEMGIDPAKELLAKLGAEDYESAAEDLAAMFSYANLHINTDK